MKYIVTLLIIGLFSVSAMARMPSPDEQVEHLSTLLDLNDEQASQISALLASRQEQAKTLMQQLADLKTQTDTEIKALLTSEQSAKFDELQERHENMGKRPPERF